MDNALSSHRKVGLEESFLWVHWCPILELYVAAETVNSLWSTIVFLIAEVEAEAETIQELPREMCCFCIHVSVGLFVPVVQSSFMISNDIVASPFHGWFLHFSKRSLVSLPRVLTPILPTSVLAATHLFTFVVWTTILPQMATTHSGYFSNICSSMDVHRLNLWLTGTWSTQSRILNDQSR